MRRLSASAQCFPIRGRFVISRGSKTEAAVALVAIEEGGSRGRGEAVPYARYGETIESVLAQIAAVRPAIEDGEGDAERLAAVRAAAPGAMLIADANEAWTEAILEHNLEACARAGVALVEQPLPAGKDAPLAKVEHIVPVCADESIHDRKDLARLRERYDAINIKLDKAGGLTEALALLKEGKDLGFEIMTGCMVGTSLAMAPALLLAPGARFADLDGPLLLAQDRPEGLRYEGSIVHPPRPELWG